LLLVVAGIHDRTMMKCVALVAMLVVAVVDADITGVKVSSSITTTRWDLLTSVAPIGYDSRSTGAGAHFDLSEPRCVPLGGSYAGVVMDRHTDGLLGLGSWEATFKVDINKGLTAAGHWVSGDDSFDATATGKPGDMLALQDRVGDWHWNITYHELCE
jgi:hypothetical protein